MVLFVVTLAVSPLKSCFPWFNHIVYHFKIFFAISHFSPCFTQGCPICIIYMTLIRHYEQPVAYDFETTSGCEKKAIINYLFSYFINYVALRWGFRSLGLFPKCS